LFNRSDDKFWAAQRLAALTTEMIRVRALAERRDAAAVRTGELGDSAAENFLNTTHEAHPAWATPASAYFRLGQSGWKPVGFERTAE
jgi:hypothetical protein